MIRKLARLNAPVDVVTGVFMDIESWPAWMPFVKQSTILERQTDRMMVRIRHVHLGHDHTQTMEFRLREDRFVQRQVKGPFKRWDGEWRFSPSPDGEGTTVTVSLEIETGVFGALIPKKVIQSTFEDFFDRTVRGAGQRVRALQRTTSSTETEAEEAAPQTLVQVYQTPGGLEIWVGGQRHFLKAG